jgi:hypothetical protein
MLEGLDKIDWKNIRHSHGPATDYPKWIRDLTSEEEAVWDEALYNIIEYSFHQMTFYEVTPYIVPFLIELLTYEQIKIKAEISFHLMALLSVSNQILHEGASSLAYARLSLKIYDAVEAGYPIYKTLLHHGEKGDRAQIAELLGYMTSRGYEIAALLRERFEQESEEVVRLSLIRALGVCLAKLWDSAIEVNRQSYYAFLFEQIEKDESREQRLEATFAIAHMMRFTTHLDSPRLAPATDLLIDEYIRIPGEVASIPLRVRRERIPRTLRKLNPMGLINLLQLPNLTPLDGHQIARELLDSAFSRTDRSNSWSRYEWKMRQEQRIYRDNSIGYFEPGQPLSLLAKAALKAIVDCEVFWQLPTNLFSFFFGLPDSRDELRALIENVSS